MRFCPWDIILDSLARFVCFVSRVLGFAFRADTVEIHVVSDKRKLVSFVFREREIKGSRDIHNLLTGDAYEMMMMLRIGIEALFLSIKR